jgi:hypothetical protein
VGTLNNFAGRRSDAVRLKHLKINDFIMRSMKFTVSFCIVALSAILIGVVFYAIFSGKSLQLEGLGQFASALAVLVLTWIGLGFLLKIVRANKADLIMKMEMTPPLRVDELNFDPSKYVEPESL